MPRDLTQARLKELLTYDRDTGHFAWRTAYRGREAGDRAGYRMPQEAHAAYLQAKARLHQFQPTPRLYGKGARQRKLAKQARRRAE